MEKSIPKYYHIPPVLIKNLVARMDILIISEHADGTRWTLLCPGNYILSMPSMTFTYKILITTTTTIITTNLVSSLLLVNTRHT